MKKLVLFFLGFITLELHCMSQLKRLAKKISPTSVERLIRLASRRRASNKFFVLPLGNQRCSGNQLKFPNCTFGYPNSCSFWPCVSCPRLEVPPERE